MTPSNIKIVYFIRRSLKSHIGANKSWVTHLNRIFDCTLFTTISLAEARQERQNLGRLRENFSPGELLYFGLPRILDPIFCYLYFFYLSFAYDVLVIHFKKRNLRFFRYLKLRSNIRFVVDYEGDAKAEKSYLINDRNSLRINDYTENITNLKNDIARQGQEIAIADAVLVSSEDYKAALQAEFPTTKIFAVPTGYDADMFSINDGLRSEVRHKLGIKEDQRVLVYLGNAYYSWQNIGKLCQLFISFPKDANFHLLLIIRKQDIPLVRLLISHYQVKNYSLMSVPFDDANAYLNAADVGVLLRSDDIMNRHSCPGKVGEYMAAGLPVIITPYIGVYSEALEEKDFALFIDDLQNMAQPELVKAAQSFIERAERSQKICDFSNHHFSVAANASAYMRMVQAIS